MADVFISYKKEDRALAERVEAALTREGYTVWWDASLTPRESWDATIEAEARAAKAILVVWTELSVVSEWVRIEAGFGKEHGKLVPIRSRACDLPFAFRHTQTADVTDWTGSTGHPGWRQALGWVSDLVHGGAGEEANVRAAAPRMRDILIARAVRGETMMYEKAAAEIGFEGQSLWGTLQAVCNDCKRRGEPLLCALVINGETSLPGSGYFAKNHPGVDAVGADAKAVWEAERDKIFAFDWVGETVPPNSAPPTQPLVDEGAAEKVWASIENSLDPRDYEDFREHFPVSKLTFEARRRIRQLEDWAAVDENDHAGINAFRADVRAKSPLFPALEQRTALIRDLARTKDREAEREQQLQNRSDEPQKPEQQHLKILGSDPPDWEQLVRHIPTVLVVIGILVLLLSTQFVA